MHVPDAKRSKLEARSQKHVMLGCSDESRGYKMVYPVTKTIIIYIDVVLEEAESWDWGRTEEVKNDILDWGEVNEEIYASSDQDESSYQEEGDGLGNTSSDGSTSGGAATPTILERRVTRALTYLQDYTSGEGLLEDESEVQVLLMFMASDDPIYYEVAVRMKRWRDVSRI